MTRKMRCAAFGAVLGIALAGCGDDDPTAREATTTATTAERQSGIGVPVTTPVVLPARNRETALLTDVRAARHPGFDRVVFEFRGDVGPGYDVRYASGPISQDGSGEAVDVDGEHVIIVRLENALDADLSTEKATPTYTGPQRLVAGLPAVSELVRIGGFEGVLTWAIGTRSRDGYVVSVLNDPSRLVIDVASG